MFCTNCGKEIKDTENFCPSCGTPVKKVDGENGNTVNTGYQPINGQSATNYQSTGYTQPTNPADEPNTGFMILSFFVPVVGIILYCIWNKEFPQKAKSCLKGFIGSIVFYFVLFCCLFTVIFNAIDEYDDSSYYHYYDHVVEIVE